MKALRTVAPTIAPARLSRDVSGTVGQVPIVRLNRLSAACQRHEFYLKLESCNPGGSIKEYSDPRG